MVQTSVGDLGSCTELYPTAIASALTTWTPPNPLKVTGPILRMQPVKSAPAVEKSIRAKTGSKPIAKRSLNLNDRADKAKARGLIDIWIKNGSLTVIEETDPKRREKKKFVRVAADE